MWFCIGFKISGLTLSDLLPHKQGKSIYILQYHLCHTITKVGGFAHDSLKDSPSYSGSSPLFVAIPLKIMFSTHPMPGRFPSLHSHFPQILRIYRIHGLVASWNLFLTMAQNTANQFRDVDPVNTCGPAVCLWGEFAFYFLFSSGLLH